MKNTDVRLGKHKSKTIPNIKTVIRNQKQILKSNLFIFILTLKRLP